MKYPKHLIVFGNASNAFQGNRTLSTGEVVRNYVATVADIGNNITIEEDLDKTYNEASLDLPAIRNEFFNTIDFKRFDVFKIYFKYFNTKEEADAATVDNLDLIFDGYIESTPMSESKMDGLNYNSLGLRSTAGLFYETNSPVRFFDGTLQTIIDTIIQYSVSTYFLTGLEVDSNISQNWVFKVGTTHFIGEVFDNIRKNYALKIFQKSNGVLKIQLPSSFGSHFNPWIMDVLNNVFEIDYGDVSQNLDSVVVIGTNCIGVAFDPITYQLKNGVLRENLVSSIIPDNRLLNPKVVVRRDLFNSEDCQRVARELLLEIAKNYVITIKALYEPGVQLNDVFIVNNSKKILNNQLWIVKHKTVEINKDGAATMTIKGYSNSLVEFPEDILISATGILDTDILELTDRVINATELH
jgi:hypothetical protein